MWPRGLTPGGCPAIIRTVAVLYQRSICRTEEDCELVSAGRELPKSHGGNVARLDGTFGVSEIVFHRGVVVAAILRCETRPGDTVRHRSNVSVLSAFRRRGQEALRLLAEAYAYSRELRRGVWDFAVEINTLRAAGATPSELRWLICKGYVVHASEITMPGDTTRTFRRPPAAGLMFGHKTCFALTDAGFVFAAHLIDGPLLSQRQAAPSPRADNADSPASSAPAKPTWDRDRQELRWGQVVVKQFKVPAPNQERILAAFEEEGWPVHLDDPLPPAAEQDPKRRLHDTINSLNRNQKRPLLRFVGDGSGEGLRWEAIPARRNGKNGKNGNGRSA